MNSKPPASSSCPPRILVRNASVAAFALAFGLCPIAEAQVSAEHTSAGSAAAAVTRAAAPAQNVVAAAKKPAAAAHPVTPPPAPAPVAPAPATCRTVVTAPAITLESGKSTLFKLPDEMVLTLRTLGDEDVVQARMLNPTTLYLLGIGVGSTNMILQDTRGVCTIVDVAVGMDAATLQAKLGQLMPEERQIRVHAAADTIVLAGTVADAVKADQAVTIANAYVRRTLDGGRIGSARGAGSDSQGGQTQAALGRQSVRVVNMLSVAANQQVLIEVKVAEVSKKLIDKLGAALHLQNISGGWAYTILADFLSGSSGLIDAFKKATGEFITIDGENKDGLVKILAEPNLMAISGQEGSFLAGGKVYFPVAQGSTASGILTTGTVAITLYEQEFGVALKFTPTVLADGRINLKVSPEVSELSPEGVAIQAFNAGGRTVAPVIATRRASTTVQLFDGQTFAIGGLIKSNAATDIKAFPILGEIPILGALFRSTAFQTERTELLFIVTPHLVKPMTGRVALPTDNYVEPNRLELFLGGRMEGTAPPPPAGAPIAPPPVQPAPDRPSGFEIK
jgi:pilus assembly protein CpaC